MRVPQLPRLRQTAADISRTPAGERVRDIYRQVNLWTAESVSSTILPGRGASLLLAACASEASSLLELGYRREDGIDFVTSLPEPGDDPVRPLTQIRAAMHHTGSDMCLFRDMLERPEPSLPQLKLVFSSWPLGGRLPDAWRPGEEIHSIHLDAGGASVPLVISFSRRIRGYALLYLWDMACGLKGKNTGTEFVFPSFQLFARAFGDFVS